MKKANFDFKELLNNNSIDAKRYIVNNPKEIKENVTNKQHFYANEFFDELSNEEIIKREQFRDSFFDTSDFQLLKSNILLIRRKQSEPKKEIYWILKVITNNNETGSFEYFELKDQKKILSILCPDAEKKNDPRCFFDVEFCAIDTRRYFYYDNLWIDICNWSIFGKSRAYIVGSFEGVDFPLKKNYSMISNKFFVCLFTTLKQSKYIKYPLVNTITKNFPIYTINQFLKIIHMYKWGMFLNEAGYFENNLISYLKF